MRYRVITWTFAFLLILPATSAVASWAPNGNQINPGITDDGGGYPLSLAPDGRGGVYLASGYFDEARLTRILDTGSLAPAWPDNGLWYFAGDWWPHSNTVVSDNAGGAFVVSSDKQCSRYDCLPFDHSYLRAHHARLDATVESWSREGIDLGSGSERGGGELRQVVSIPNGLGSALTTWADPVGDFSRLTAGGVLRAQRVDITGTLPWGPNGVVVRDTLLRAFNQTMAPDGSGGAYVFWQDDRSPGIYGQHIAADGRALWTPDGIPIALAPMTNLGPPVAISDGSLGAIVAWSGASGAQSGVFAARVTDRGIIPSPQGQQVFQAGSSEVDGLRIVPAEPGGAIIAWRSLQAGSSDRILAQHLDHAVRPRWPQSGVVVCQAQGTRDQLAIASDLRGGVYLAWIDSRPEFSVYGMHLDRSGDRVTGWSPNGEPICARIPLPTSAGGTAEVVALELATVEAGHERQSSFVADDDALGPEHRQASAIVVWTDNRTKFGIDFTFASPFAMLLTPRGPAAAAAAPSLTPVSTAPDGQPSVPNPNTPSSLSIAPNGPDNLRVQLPDDSHARLELFDLAGRKVRALDLGGLGRGSHDVPILAGASLPSGVYMARLVHGAQATSARFVIFR